MGSNASNSNSQARIPAIASISLGLPTQSRSLGQFAHDLKNHNEKTPPGIFGLHGFLSLVRGLFASGD
jgi:hypothetical protein